MVVSIVRLVLVGYSVLICVDEFYLQDESSDAVMLAVRSGIEVADAIEWRATKYSRFTETIRSKCDSQAIRPVAEIAWRRRQRA